MLWNKRHSKWYKSEKNCPWKFHFIEHQTNKTNINEKNFQLPQQWKLEKIQRQVREQNSMRQMFASNGTVKHYSNSCSNFRV